MLEPSGAVLPPSLSWYLANDPHGVAKGIVKCRSLLRAKEYMISNSNRSRLILAVFCLWAVNGFSADGEEPIHQEARANDESLVSSTPISSRHPFSVVASVHPLALLVKEIGGDGVVVTTLIGEGVDPHNFEPTPSVLRSLVAADLVVVNGAGVDGWSQRAAVRGRVVVAEEVAIMLAHEQGRDAPPTEASLWLEPMVMARVAEQIAERLCALDSEKRGAVVGDSTKARLGGTEGQGADGERCAMVRARGRAVAARIAEISGPGSSARETPQRHIISYHLVWGQLASHLGLSEIGGFAECETKARSWGLLRDARRVRDEEGTSSLIVEPLHVGAPEVSQLADELGLRPVVVDSLGWRAADYGTFLAEAIQGLRVASQQAR
jgi:hypothetical protein